MARKKKSKGIFGSFPEEYKNLLSVSGKNFVDTVGENAIRDAVRDILIGENIRSLTEIFTKRRLLLVSASLLIHYQRLTQSGDMDHVKNILTNAGQLLQKNSKDMNWILQWYLGLTGKSVQNVLRSDLSGLEDYVQEVADLIHETAQETNKAFGELRLTTGVQDNPGGVNVCWDWEKLLLFTMIIGTETLAIRGSEKSMYGKLFGDLVLGTILSMLGYQYLSKDNRTLTQSNVFWLSDSDGGRESDATLVYSPGKIIRFDIGFIGKGNPEIPKDKLSRYESELKTLGTVLSLQTIVIIDKLSVTSKTSYSAERSNAKIIQMSEDVWPVQLASELSQLTGKEHQLTKMTGEKAKQYIGKEIQKININNFLK